VAKILNSQKPQRALVPVSSGGDLKAEIVAAVQSLSDNRRVAEFSFAVNKRTGVGKIRAIGRDGQNVIHQFVGPGMTETSTFHPTGNTSAEKRQGRDANIISDHLRGLSQDESAERLNCSQSLVSKVLRREGYR
jgi:hypothetical protein